VFQAFFRLYFQRLHQMQKQKLLPPDIAPWAGTFVMNGGYSYDSCQHRTGLRQSIGIRLERVKNPMIPITMKYDIHRIVCRLGTNGGSVSASISCCIIRIRIVVSIAEQMSETGSHRIQMKCIY
jgi:hypothetical protein